jgi:hypothetical protein
MPVQIVRPRSIGVAPGGARRAILLAATAAAQRGYGQAQTGTEKAA